MGLLSGLKNIFGKKEEISEGPVTRLESRRLVEQIGDTEFIPRYKLAQKMREDKEMDTPLVKRKRY